MDIHPLLLAGVTGIFIGFALCVPVGPINLTIINEGARRGFKWALLIGLGSTLMEITYCGIAFTGFASILNDGYVKAGMELFSFAFLFFLGIKFLVARNIPKTTTMEERIEEKLHPHSAFMIGFVRTMGNPGVLVFWIIAAANLISREWVPPTWPGKSSCVAGVAVGALVWFLGLSWAVSLGHKKFSEKTLLKMEHFSGILLLLLALIHAVRIIWQMANQTQS